jgi:hypothetical protein
MIRKSQMKIKRPVAGGTASRIFNLVTGLNLTGSDRTPTPTPTALFRLRLLSSRPGFPATYFTPKRSHSRSLGGILPLKCRRNPPIPRGGKTVPGDRKLPEGTTGGCLFQNPPRGKDAV